MREVGDVPARCAVPFSSTQTRKDKDMKLTKTDIKQKRRRDGVGTAGRFLSHAEARRAQRDFGAGARGCLRTLRVRLRRIYPSKQSFFGAFPQTPNAN